MAKNISPQEAAKRLASAGFNFADRYQKGVANKGADWQRGAAAAAPNYAAGVQKALADNRFAKGVQAASASNYDEGVRNKGVNNWPTGMQLAENRYTEGVAPFTSLWNTALGTPRGPKGSPANLQRMTQNVERFKAAKK